MAIIVHYSIIARIAYHIYEELMNMGKAVEEPERGSSKGWWMRGQYNIDFIIINYPIIAFFEEDYMVYVISRDNATKHVSYHDANFIGTACRDLGEFLIDLD